MIMADKIVQLRKKNGWSQEDLSAQLGVSRQAISKWESAQSIPDITRILDMSQLFGVSTDFLIKDEMDWSALAPADSNVILSVDTSSTSLRQITMEEARAFLKVKDGNARLVPLGVTLYALAAAFLIFVNYLVELPGTHLTETQGDAIGMAGFLVLAGVATALVVAAAIRVKPFEYLEKSSFETAYGVDGMVKAQQEKLHSGYVTKMIAGTALSILALITLITGALLGEDQVTGVNNWLIQLVALGVAVAGFSLYLFINASMLRGALLVLLQEGSYTAKSKRDSKITAPITVAYWLVAVAIYIGYSYISQNWGLSWLIMAIAAVLYGALLAVMSAVKNSKSTN